MTSSGPETPRTVPELAFIGEMERAVMDGDAVRAGRYLADDVRYRVGARPVVVGIPAVFAYIAEQSAYARWVGHTLHDSLAQDGLVVVEVDSHFERVRDGAAITLPCTDVYRFRHERIADWRVYADLSVFAG